MICYCHVKNLREVLGQKYDVSHISSQGGLLYFDILFLSKEVGKRILVWNGRAMAKSLNDTTQDEM